MQTLQLCSPSVMVKMGIPILFNKVDLLGRGLPMEKEMCTALVLRKLPEGCAEAIVLPTLSRNLIFNQLPLGKGHSSSGIPIGGASLYVLPEPGLLCNTASPPHLRNHS